MHNKNLKNNLNASFSFPTWRNFVKAGAIFGTVAGMLLFTTSCGSNTNEEEEHITIEQPTKGVITKVVETQPGQFIVESEEIIDSPNASAAYITYLDGRKEVITAEEMSKRITDKDLAAATDTAMHFAMPAQDTAVESNSGTVTSTTGNTKSTNVVQNGNTTTVTDADGNTTVVVNNTQPAYHSSYNPGLHTLSYVLMGSALGYYMGKSMMMPPNPNIYRTPVAYNTAASGSYGSSSSAGRTYSSLRSTSKTTTVPRSNYTSARSGKSGYFSSSKSSSTTSKGSSSSGRSGGSSFSG